MLHRMQEDNHKNFTIRLEKDIPHYATNYTTGMASYDHYHGGAARLLGSLHLTLAIMAAALNVKAVTLDTNVASSGYALLCSPLWLTAGTLGIISSWRKTGALIVAVKVLSILSACSLLIYIPMSVFQTLTIKPSYYDQHFTNFPQDPFCDQCDNREKWYVWDTCSHCFGAFRENPNYASQKVVSVSLAAVGVLELLTATLAATLCCHVMCCSRQTRVRAGRE